MPKRLCNFSNLQKKYTGFRPGTKPTLAVCNLCNSIVSVANNGSGALDSHLSSEKHKSHIRDASISKFLDGYLIKKNSTLETKIAIAEGTMAFHTVFHHMSYSQMDCTGPLLKSLFEDSERATKFSCGRTKTEAIVNNVFSPHSIEMITKELAEVEFIGLGTDGSNHGNIKLFPVVIQYLNPTKGIQVRLLDFRCLENETAVTISSYVKNTVVSHGILEKLAAIVLDNTNTNFGGVKRKGKNNIFRELQKIKPQLVGVGCSAHIIHNSVQHGLDQFGLYDVDSIVYKLYEYFSIYTVRTTELKSFCQFVDVNYRNILRHVHTRWLSLFPAIERILQMFEALKSYFSSQEKPPVTIKRFFEDDIAECFLLFVHSVMALFHSKIALAEKKDNSILEIMSIFEDLFDKVNERKKSNFVPLAVTTILSKLRKDGKDIGCDGFMARVQVVYHEILEYMKLWTESFSEFEVFLWLDFKQNEYFEYCDVEPSLLYLLEKNVRFDNSLLHDQIVNLKRFLELKIDDNEFFQHKSASARICEFFASNKTIEGYSELLKIAQYFYAIPSHNANIERAFSLMNNQWTKERNRLSVENIGHILKVKFNFADFDCLSFQKYLKDPANSHILKKIRNSEKYQISKISKEADSLKL